ncbi:MAG: hypothetical protein AAGE65_01990 [Planctomycetota bacterium]
MPAAAPAFAVPAIDDPAAVSDLERSCHRRGELFDRCFREYAQAMRRLTGALETYDDLLRHGPAWQRSR